MTNDSTTKQDEVLRRTLARVQDADALFSFFVELAPNGVIEESLIPGLHNFTRSRSQRTIATAKGTRQAIEELDKHPSVVALKGSQTYSPC